MLAPADLRGGIGRFLAGRTFAALTARDRAGRLWISPLTGQPGFLRPRSATTLDIAAVPAPGDPLSGLAAGQPIGLVVVEFAARRRVRVNGTLISAGAGGLRVEAEQVFGNLAVDPAAALLFADFGPGKTLQLSGTAFVEWTGPGSAGDDGGTGRRVRFTPECVVAGALLDARAAAPVVPYPANPPLSPGSPGEAERLSLGSSGEQVRQAHGQ